MQSAFRVQRLPFYFLVFFLPSRMDKPEQVKKKRAWNGMEATPFVPPFFLPPSPSLARSQRSVCMARTERAVDERTQRRPSAIGSGSGERHRIRGARSSVRLAPVFSSLFRLNLSNTMDLIIELSARPHFRSARTSTRMGKKLGNMRGKMCGRQGSASFGEGP